MVKKAVELAKKCDYKLGIAKSYNRLAASYVLIGKLDSASINIDLAINWAKLAANQTRLAAVYSTKADIEMKMGNLDQAVAFSKISIDYAQKAKSDRNLANGYLSIGNIYFLQKNHNEAIRYYNLALPYYHKLKAFEQEATTLMNLGTMYKHLKKYSKGIANFKRAIFLMDSIKYDYNNWMHYGNYSELLAFAGKKNEAIEAAFKALYFSEKYKNPIQIAYGNGFVGSTYFYKKEYSAAIPYSQKATEMAEKLKENTVALEMATILAKCYEEKGEFSKTIEYLKKSRALSDTLNQKNFNSKIANLQTSLRLDEKEAEITILEKDNLIKSQNLNRQRIIMFGSLGFILLAGLGIWQMFNRRKLKEKLHELELRNQIAADLYDEVGSSLSSINMLSQMVASQPNMAEKDKSVLQKMTTNSKETMEKMSDIVWMIKPGENDTTGLYERMTHFLREICEASAIEFDFKTKNIDGLELNMTQRKNIYLIFKEAVNNSVKYSGTKLINVSFEKPEKQLILTIQDFGKGFNLEHIRRGNGLENMQNRAKELGGKLNFNSEIGVGTKVKLKI